eukprot:gene5878-6798_t
MVSAENAVKGSANTVIVFKPIGVDTALILPPGSIITDDEQAARMKEKAMSLMYSLKEASLIDSLFNLIAQNQINLFKQLYNYVEQDEYVQLSKMLVTVAFGCNNSLRLMRYFIHCDYKAVDGQQFIKDILRPFTLQLVGDKGLNLASDLANNNYTSLSNYARQLATIITSVDSIDKLPVPIKIVAMFYHEIWPQDDTFQGISNFLINRFFATVLISPDSFNLVPPQIQLSARSSSNLAILGRFLATCIASAPWSFGQLDQATHVAPIKQIFKESNYFKTVLGSRFSTQSYQLANEATMSQLHLFHRLVWQNKAELIKVIKDEAVSTQFDQLINKLGDYNAKVQFQFLTPNELKSVKYYMEQKNEDISYIGYITKNGKRGPVKRVLVVGINKIVTFKATNGKVAREGHLLDLLEIVSTAPAQFEFVFKTFRINGTAEDCDHIVTCVRRIYEYSFNYWPHGLKMKLKIQPPSRLEAISYPDHTPTSVMVAAYKALCAYHQTQVKQTVCWYIENAFASTGGQQKAFNLKLFTKHTREPLSNADLVPLIHALRYDWYFDSFVVKNYKIDLKELLGEITTMLSSNATFTSITLSNLSLPKESMMQLFDVIQNQKSLKLTKLDVSRNVFDDRSISSFIGYLQYGQTSAIQHLNISSIGISQPSLKLLFEALKRGSFAALVSLDFSGNKVGDNASDIGRWLSNEGSNLRSLNLSDTLLKPKSLIIDHGKSKLEILDLSRNLFKLREDALALGQLLNGLTSLQTVHLTKTTMPSDTMREILMFVEKRSIIQMSLGENSLVRSAVTALIASSAIHNIKRIDLTDNDITDGGIKELGRALYGNQTLETLILNGCFRGGPGAQRSKAVLSISNFLQSSGSIEILRMRGGVKGQQLQRCIIPLLLSLGSVHSLQEFDVTGHAMGNQGAVALAKAIYQNRSIRTLIIDNNNIGTLGYANIKNSLKQNHIIKDLPMPIYDITDIKYNASEVEQRKMRSLILKIETYLLRNQEY